MIIGLNSFSASPRPDEGMWLPMFVERLNWTDIQEMGLQLTPEELYSINNSSLKDAVVGLASGSAPGGYFCTGEIVSDQGLMFTNHHCGYDIIQNHSTIEHDYLTEGFWAMSKEEELPNPGLTASFLVRMEDLTETVMAQLTDEMTGEERNAKVREITKNIKEEASEDGKYDVVVKSFYAGNEYYMLVYETFKDVRLVGAPPSSIGKFGGDTDNWMWPRHT
ncbi:MAG: S46 family peptidase, partial [Bacteroidota bacterium]